MAGQRNVWKWIVGGGCALVLLVFGAVALVLTIGIGMGVNRVNKTIEWRSHESVKERSEAAAKEFLDHVVAGDAQAAKDVTPERKLLFVGGGRDRTADKLVAAKITSYTIVESTCDDVEQTLKENNVEKKSKVGVTCEIYYDATDAAGRPWFGGLIYWILFERSGLNSEDPGPDPLYIQLAGGKQGVRPDTSEK